MELLNQNILYENNYKILFIVVSIIGSFISCILLIPKFLDIGHTLELYDYPEVRKVHNKPLLRSGGIALFISYILPIFIIFNLLNINNQIFVVFLSGNLLFFLIGLLDDFYNISPYIKLFFQILITVLLFYCGVKIIGFNISTEMIPEGNIIFPKIFSLIFTLLWVVGITNSINWIDGLDGLASGLSLIFALGILIKSLLNGQIEIAIISASLIGSNIGFLRYNFNPAKVLMGDSGSYFLGFAMAILSLEVSNNGTIGLFSIVPIFFLAIPIFDMVIVIVNRLLKGINPFYPDRSHLHHRLLKVIGSQKYTVIFIYLVSLIFTSLALFLIFNAN